jgi:hypothetical protein
MRSLLALLILIVLPVTAQSKELRLVCTVHANQAGALARGDVRPRDVVTITYDSDGSASILSVLHKRTLEGSVAEHEVVGIWRGPDFSEEIYINRYTSEYRYRTVAVDAASKQTILYGICQAAGKPAV